MTTKTIFITGTSSGLGKLTAIHFAKLGWNVAATMRTPEKETELMAYDNIKLFKLDVTNLAEVDSAVHEAIAAFGKIDVVVNNAGMGSYGALELAEEATIDWQFAVNARGPINVIRKFLPHFRAEGGGMFINISSFMGVTTAVPLGSLYNMSKFALEGLTEGLYYELKPLNIELRLIEQGGSTGNNFVNSIRWNKDENITAYDDMMNKIVGMMSSGDSSRLDDPQIIVDAIAAQATGESKQFRTVVGEAGKGLLALRNSVPIEQYLETIARNYN
ncbi:SDR family oxidoreductase [Paenibacillus sacheonensis]|uniref:SDR family NAD(P)-dependent oxidoreductase n=1 Tax=Paenibacillus sacheonensis TaxID=742054 RepID=A0A7X4YS73_9BACL|nr:SDR family oxidoreductase [Paenibacillus sacheonensis]MBM7566707.1 NAD(P)-dependent dehydrogenase (short-subunit alcohol dehydrogenase family) [Paenibacillus sacheonensis]NBC70686.1 SDR family NAD(P)-dependent oxidoreductase [Paenibacillus sacheonensis]